MPTLNFTNSSEQELWIIIEPIANRYKVDPMVSISIEYDDDDDIPLEFIYHSPTEIGIWTHGRTRVYADGKLLAAT